MSESRGIGDKGLRDVKVCLVECSLSLYGIIFD